MTNKRRNSLEQICSRINKLMENEDRKDLEFRFIITATEFGDIGKYITHDPKLNPGARPHGTKEDEKLAYGQAFIQIMALAQLRDINVKEAIFKGFENWEQADWRKKQSMNGYVSGVYINPIALEGKAYVVSKKYPLSKLPHNSILVTEYFTPDMTQYANKALAIITDHGGTTCHAANIAREFRIPCIVGTGNATKLIKTNANLLLKPDGKVEIK